MSKVLVDTHEDTVVATRPRMQKSSYIPSCEVITEDDHETQEAPKETQDPPSVKQETHRHVPASKPDKDSGFMSFFDVPKESAPEADPDSCRMLLNPMVTVSHPSKSAPPMPEKKTFVPEPTEYTEDHREPTIAERQPNDFTSFIADLPTSAPPLVSPMEKLSPQARRELKAELFLEYQNRNPDYKYCPIVLSLEESSLEEIQQAVEFVRRKKNHENTKTNVKNTLVLGAQGMVALVNKYNLVGCDMSEWPSDFAYELNKKMEYEDLLDELIRTYRNRLEMPIEVKFLLAVGGSFARGVYTKKQSLAIEAKAQAKAEEDMRRRMEEQARMTEMAQASLAQQMRAFQMEQQQQPIEPPRSVEPPPPVLHFDGPTRSAAEMKEFLKDHILDDDEESVMSLPLMEVPPEEPEKEPVKEEPVKKTKAKAVKRPTKKKAKDDEDESLLLLV